MNNSDALQYNDILDFDHEDVLGTFDEQFTTDEIEEITQLSKRGYQLLI